MNALESLNGDHKRIRDLFEQVRAAETIENKRELFERIKDELDLHCHLEETVFYPALNDRVELRDILEECYDEHQEITDLLEEIDETDDDEPAQAMFEDDLDELIECVEFHLGREESELFSQAPQFLDQARLGQLGSVLDDSREKLIAA